MRRALVPLGLVLIVAGACAKSTPNTVSPTRLASQTAKAGAVDVKIEPVRIDSTGAAFKISFDTHSVDLGFDVAGKSALQVGGRAWTGPKWSGDRPGGHHREGTLTFDAGGPAEGMAQLTIGGLSTPVNAKWTLGGGR